MRLAGSASEAEPVECPVNEEEEEKGGMRRRTRMWTSLLWWMRCCGSYWRLSLMAWTSVVVVLVVMVKKARSGVCLTLRLDAVCSFFSLLVGVVERCLLLQRRECSTPSSMPF